MIHIPDTKALFEVKEISVETFSAVSKTGSGGKPSSRTNYDGVSMFYFVFQAFQVLFPAASVVGEAAAKAAYE